MHYQWREQDVGERIDKILAQGLDISRTQLQNWLKTNRVRCNDKILNTKSRPKIGDIIEINPPEPVPLDLQPEDYPLDVLFEDPDIIVLNKRPGEIVHPGAGVRQGTLVSALLHHCRGQLSGIGGVERPGIVHRLDKDTSGVLVVAKNDAAHQELSRQFKQHEVKKIYQAFVLGKPRHPNGTWEWNIGRHRVKRHKMAALKTGGRQARTDFRILRTWERATLLELRLHTGRTHQIRVHAAAAGHPVIGDAAYGRSVAWVKEAGVPRQLLHARQLTLKHPQTQKKIEFTAPVPEDFQSFRKFLDTHE